jgi:hypothetical protein
MTGTKRLALTVVATFAIALLAASAAYAAAIEAPFYGVETAKEEFARLGEGENREIKSPLNSKNYELKAGKIVVTCTNEKAKAGAKIIGSKAGEPGTGEQADEYSGCSVTGNGEGCKAESFTTKTLKTELVFDAETKRLYTLFAPKEGTELATLNFSGTCTTKTTSLTGNVASETFNEASEEIETEKPAGGELKEFVSFPSTAIKQVVKVKAGLSGAATEVGLKAFGGAATLVGKSEVALESGKKFAGQPLLNTLKFDNGTEIPFKIPVGTSREFSVKFLGLGRAVNVSVMLTNTTAFEVLTPMAGVTDCVAASLSNGESCTTKIKCKGVLNNSGEVKVTDPNAPVAATRTLLCT